MAICSLYRWGSRQLRKSTLPRSFVRGPSDLPPSSLLEPPSPLTNTALDVLAGASIFTKLDLKSMFNLIHIREGNEWKTAFNSHWPLQDPGNPIQLMQQSSGFINDVRHDMLGHWVFAYLDAF